jgi:hypothetical protein
MFRRKGTTNIIIDTEEDVREGEGEKRGGEAESRGEAKDLPDPTKAGDFL